MLWKTPYHLRAWGIPEDCGEIDLARVYLSFGIDTGNKDPKTGKPVRDKSLMVPFLMVALGAQLTKAIAEVGAPEEWKRRVGQQFWADMWNVDRSTMNRLIGAFTGGRDPRWDKPCQGKHHRHGPGITRRQCWSQRKKQQHVEVGHQLHDHEPESIRQVLPFLEKLDAGVGVVLGYKLRLPREKQPSKKTAGDDTTRDARNLADFYGDKCFDRHATLNGFKTVGLWMCHPNLPASVRCECALGQMRFNFQSTCSTCNGRGWYVPTDPVTGKSLLMSAGARVFMFVLHLMGIGDFGYLDLTQKALGKIFGVHKNTIAKWEDEWEHLKVLQHVPGKTTWEHCGERFQGRKCPRCGKIGGKKGDKNGPQCVDRKPHRLVWLPGQLLENDIVKVENERFNAVSELLVDKGNATYEELAEPRRIHLGLIKAWTAPLQKHSLAALWTECRKLYNAAGIAQSLRDALFPIFKE